MGAFFICKKDNGNNTNLALKLFAEMGFTSPVFLEVGDWLLFAYPKMTTAISNVVSYRDCKLVSVGTPVYKGLDYSSSLVILLQDYLSGNIDTEQLIGQYTLIFCQENTIEILCDPLRSKHLFTDIYHSMLSSHMLPICQCFEGYLHVNKMAFCEKFLTGFIMPPNTLFEEIIEIDKQIAESISHEGIGIGFIRTTSSRVSGLRTKVFKNCFVEQVNCLRDYFQLLRNSAKDGIDIGLSGGYDSRLGLACLTKFTKGRIHLHSHSTENVHQKDFAIAKQMADYVGIPCHTVPTKKLCHCDHVDDILRKNILYFDGRSSFSIGGCGEVYTSSYRKKSTEFTAFTLTGVGGELYRNIFDIGFRSIRFDRFMEDKVFSQSFRKAIPKRQYRKIRNDIINRAVTRLGIDRQKRQPKAVAYRYYCEIMMPDGQGAALDAYNQVSCCVAPFMEPKIIAKGYEAIPFHNTGGEFEAKLIEYIDPGLAAIPTSYGYPLTRRPIKARVKERLRTFIPTSLWNNLSLVLTNRQRKYSDYDVLNELCANSSTMKKAYSYMVDLFPEIKFSRFLQTGEDIRRAQFVAMTLYVFRERIKEK